MDINSIMNIAFHEPEIDTPELVQELQIATIGSAANDTDKKMYSYRFEFKDNKASGNIRTDSPPEKARQEIQDKFFHYELETFELLN